MATLAETQDAPCALPSARRRTLAMTLYNRSRGAHARARSPWPRAQPWRDHRVFYVAVKATLTPDWLRHVERHTALTLAEEEAHRSPTLPHHTSSERHHLRFAPTIMAGGVESSRSPFDLLAMAVAASRSSCTPPISGTAATVTTRPLASVRGLPAPRPAN